MSVFTGEQCVSPRLFVLSGIHEGATVSLGATHNHHIGSSLDGDIVLRDQGIAASHVTLGLESGVVRLASHADHVQVDGRMALPAGHVCESSLPVSFSIGAVHMKIAYAKEDEKNRCKWPSLRNKTLLPAAAVLTCALLYLMLYIPEVASGPTTQTNLADARKVAQQVPLDVVRQQLATQLNASGLGHLNVQTSTGRVQVSGELPLNATEQWREVQMWFDRTHGVHYLLQSNLTQAHAPQVVIKAIWLGNAPYVIDGKGARCYPGAIMSDGWVLEKIGMNELVLAKNGRQHILRL
ncbi:MAG: SctD/MshK family protein [Advenella sp.]|uniref:SctD/MshK family protein n=1 Tax=Advenella sp. TaxID=1872388 RepID=UPI003F9D968A